MIQWGTYDPTNFKFAATDVSVPEKTKDMFRKACCGYVGAYLELGEKEHFEQMSAPMVNILMQLPICHKHYRHIGPSAPVLPSFSYPINDSAVPKSSANGTSLIAPQTARSMGSSIIHTGNDTATTRAHSPEVGMYSTGSEAFLSETEVSILAPPVREAAAACRKRMTCPAPKAVKISAKTKLHGGQRTTVFGHKQLADCPRSLPLVKLQETMRKCGSFGDAFVMALHAHFRYEELKGAFPRQVDRERLQVATALARDFCQRRNEPEPTIRQLHSAFSRASNSIKH